MPLQRADILRLRQQAPQPGLGRREWQRLLSMFMMLGILYMMINYARDPGTWRWLANDPEGGKRTAVEPPPVGENPDSAASKADKDEPQWETVVPGPTDEDPDERDAIKEEFQAITDQSKVAMEEMPAYWRLFRWTRAQTYDQMLKRADRNPYFTNFFEIADKKRGKLVYLKLHLKRTLPHDPEENSAGVKRLYEAWGWTEESKSNPYVLLFPDKPPKLPLGADVHEEATFVGYFFKVMSYEAFDVRRAAPVLIGRLHWHENEAEVALREQRGSEYTWPVIGIGTLILLGVVGGWMWQLRHPRRRSLVQATPEKQQDIERWIAGAEHGTLPPEDPPAGPIDWDANPGGDGSRGGQSSAVDWTDPNRPA